MIARPPAPSLPTRGTYQTVGCPVKLLDDSPVQLSRPPLLGEQASAEADAARYNLSLKKEKLLAASAANQQRNSCSGCRPRRPAAIRPCSPDSRFQQRPRAHRLAVFAVICSEISATAPTVPAMPAAAISHHRGADISCDRGNSVVAQRLSTLASDRHGRGGT
jgi:hypothetical protein